MTRPASSIFSSKLRHLGMLAAIAAVVLLGLFVMNRGMMRQESNELVGPFLEERQSFDVLLFGSSHTICSIYPAQLWEENGIRAYNLGGHGQSMAASYWTMRMAAARHKPKIAVLDVYKVQDSGAGMNRSYAHTSFDAYPLSAAKWHAVRGLYPGDPQTQAELLFPLRLYHSRWDEFDSAMAYAALGRRGEPSAQLGAEIRYAITPFEEFPLVPQEEAILEDTAGVRYAMAFVDFCRENDILPVLINLPCQASEEQQRAVNGLLAYAAEAGVETVNFQYLNLLDPDTDWQDGIDHVNLSGGRKLTAYLGQRLRALLPVEPEQEDPLWDDRAAASRAEIGDAIQRSGSLAESLLLLCRGGFTAELTLPGDAVMDTVTRKLADQLGDRLTVYADTQSGLCGLRVLDSAGEVITEKQFSWQTVK